MQPFILLIIALCLIWGTLLALAWALCRSAGMAAEVERSMASKSRSEQLLKEMGFLPGSTASQQQRPTVPPDSKDVSLVSLNPNKLLL